MTILVTRPSPAADELVNRLHAAGFAAYALPLIAFSAGRQLNALPALFNSLSKDDLAFIVSRHVVHYAHPFLSQKGITWPTAPNWFAIGKTSALSLHKISHLPVKYPLSRETTEFLLQLPELQNIAGKRALILRGNSGRELLGEELKNRGATVIFCECYQRIAMSYDGEAEALRGYEQGVDTLVVTSGEMLQQLFTMIPLWYRENWLLRCRLIVVSERLASQSRDLGWQDIHVAENADNDALLRTLQQT